MVQLLQLRYLALALCIALTIGANASPIAKKEASKTDTTTTVEQESSKENGSNKLLSSIFNRDKKAKKLTYEQLQDSIEVLNKTIASTHSQVGSLRNQIDSLNDAIVQIQNGKLYEHIGDYQKEFGNLDTITVVVICANMNYRCSEKLIGTLQRRFDRISNTQLRNDYQEWAELLKVYSKTYSDLFEIGKKVKDRVIGCNDLMEREDRIEALKKDVDRLLFVHKFYKADEKSARSTYLNTMVDATRDLLRMDVSKDDYNRYERKYKR